MTDTLWARMVRSLPFPIILPLMLCAMFGMLIEELFIRLLRIFRR